MIKLKGLVFLLFFYLFLLYTSEDCADESGSVAAKARILVLQVLMKVLHVDGDELIIVIKGHAQVPNLNIKQ